MAVLIDQELCTGCKMCSDVCPVDAISGDAGKPQSIDENKCVLCGQCVQMCSSFASVFDEEIEPIEKKLSDRKMLKGIKEPLFAAYYDNNIHKVVDILNDKNQFSVVQCAPAVRVAIAEDFGMDLGSLTPGKMAAALRKLGFDRVYDTNFSADLTIMEEGTELIERVTKNEKLPMFTSCCPAWVKYMENFHPDKTKYLSSAKSPIGMQGAVIKTYFAHKKHIDPEKIISVAVTPCTAKKAEIAREELCDAGKLLNIEEMRDNDYVITTKELVQWCKEEGMDLGKITPSKYDSVLGEGTGAGMIFGNTGGVMEAALRTVYRVLEGKEAPADFYQLRPVRGLNNRKEAEVTIAGKNLRVCILYGTAAAEEFLAEDMSGYHFVEVMTCPGGCISGAGQPDCGSVPVSDAVRKKRIASLYQADERAQYRNSMDNPEIGMIYNEFFKEPLSLLSETLLHTTYKSK